MPREEGAWMISNMAMYAKTKTRKALTKLWLCDTGCGHDLVGLKDAAGQCKYFYKAGKINFETAAGFTPSETKVPLDLEYIAEKITPWVLVSTPAVLSIGRRARTAGYSFICLSGKWPCWIVPKQGGGMEIVPMEVEDDCPLYNDTPDKLRMSNEEVKKHYGVTVRNGRCIISHDDFMEEQTQE